jgi:acetylornithine deacetylase
MGPILTEVEQLARELRAGPPHPLLGTGSIHAGVISGGDADSVYPERCDVTLERRRVPGETPNAAEEELQRLLARCRAGDSQLDASLEPTFSCEPFQADVMSSIVTTLQSALAQAGSDADPVGLPYWTDAAILAEAGVPTVVFGPAGDGEHAIDEHVDVASIAICVETILSTARMFCS